MKVAIVGSREFTQLGRVDAFVAKLAAKYPDVHIISGGAVGVDQQAERAARTLKLGVTIFRPDWKQFGLSAGYRRNELIVREADVVVAFWDGRSRGTKHSIDLAEKAGKPVHIYLPKKLPAPVVEVAQRASWSSGSSGRSFACTPSPTTNSSGSTTPLPTMRPKTGSKNAMWPCGMAPKTWPSWS